MERFYIPQPAWILDAIHTHLIPLPDYVPTTDRSAGARLRRARLGV
jgi:hypothetical protein